MQEAIIYLTLIGIILYIISIKNSRPTLQKLAAIANTGANRLSDGSFFSSIMLNYLEKCKIEVLINFKLDDVYSIYSII